MARPRSAGRLGGGDVLVADVDRALLEHAAAGPAHGLGQADQIARRIELGLVGSCRSGSIGRSSMVGFYAGYHTRNFGLQHS